LEPKIPKPTVRGIGIGNINTEAIVLPGLENSGYDIIIGFPLIRKYGLTRVFEGLFKDEDDHDSEPVPTTEVHSVCGAPPPVSPKRVRTATSIGEIPGIDQPRSENTLGIDPEDYNIEIDWEETPIISSIIGLNVLVPKG
jgi:hypothetical protein